MASLLGTLPFPPLFGSDFSHALYPCEPFKQCDIRIILLLGALYLVNLIMATPYPLGWGYLFCRIFPPEYILSLSLKIIFLNCQNMKLVFYLTDFLRNSI